VLFSSSSSSMIGNSMPEVYHSTALPLHMSQNLWVV
jgi:hypothetical protein